jgi:hypothetical protein
MDAHSYGGPRGALLQRTITNAPQHPFARLLWNGTCDEGQLTRGGFEDARAHGEDWWSVYGELVGDVKEGLWVRISPEERTAWVASALLAGMDSALESAGFEVHVEPATVRTLLACGWEKT